MALLNIDIPLLYLEVSDQQLLAEPQGDWWSCIAYAAQSKADRALLFHIRLKNGHLRNNVPLHRLRHKFVPDSRQYPLDYLQLWNCFGNEITVTQHSYLSGNRVVVLMKDKIEVPGMYLMTFDWLNNSYSDCPSDYKCGHLIALDNGQLALQPNNRLIYVHDMNFGEPRSAEVPKYRIDDEVFSVENSEKWVATEAYNYDFVGADKQVIDGQ